MWFVRTHLPRHRHHGTPADAVHDRRRRVYRVWRVWKGLSSICHQGRHGVDVRAGEARRLAATRHEQLPLRLMHRLHSGMPCQLSGPRATGPTGPPRQTRPYAGSMHRVWFLRGFLPRGRHHDEVTWPAGVPALSDPPRTECPIGPAEDFAVTDLVKVLVELPNSCLLYTSDAADEEDSVDLG